MLRETTRAKSTGYIRTGQVDLSGSHTLRDLQLRLLSSQSALRSANAMESNQLKIDGRRRHMNELESDLKLVARLIAEHGEDEPLT